MAGAAVVWWCEKRIQTAGTGRGPSERLFVVTAKCKTGNKEQGATKASTGKTNKKTWKTQGHGESRREDMEKEEQRDTEIPNYTKGATMNKGKHTL